MFTLCLVVTLCGISCTTDFMDAIMRQIMIIEITSVGFQRKPSFLNLMSDISSAVRGISISGLVVVVKSHIFFFLSL